MEFRKCPTHLTHDCVYNADTTWDRTAASRVLCGNVISLYFPVYTREYGEITLDLALLVAKDTGESLTYLYVESRTLRNYRSSTRPRVYSIAWGRFRPPSPATHHQFRGPWHRKLFTPGAIHVFSDPYDQCIPSIIDNLYLLISDSTILNASSTYPIKIHYTYSRSFYSLWIKPR